jgi:ATP-binding cassette subfamily C (CFTR/MRP) protein 1
VPSLLPRPQATFKHLTENPFRLSLPDFSVSPGELVAVVGRVGAGKSSILQAILGNMTLESGEAHAAGVMAYVPQTAWCQNLTLRENIVFGQPWEEERYNQVIHACALELDLQILAAGDQSKVGRESLGCAAVPLCMQHCAPCLAMHYTICISY